MPVFLETKTQWYTWRFLWCISISCAACLCECFHVSFHILSWGFLVCLGWIWTATAAFPERHEGSDQSEICEWSGCRRGWYWSRWCLQRVPGGDNKESVWPCTQLVQGTVWGCRCWLWWPAAGRSRLAHCALISVCRQPVVMRGCIHPQHPIFMRTTCSSLSLWGRCLGRLYMR